MIIDYNLTIAALELEDSSSKNFFYALDKITETKKSLVLLFSEGMDVSKYRKKNFLSKPYLILKSFQDFLEVVDKEKVEFPIFLQLNSLDRSLFFEWIQKDKLVLNLLLIKANKEYDFHPFIFGSMQTETSKYLETLALFDTKRFNLVTNTNYPEEIRIKELYRFKA